MYTKNSGKVDLTCTEEGFFCERETSCDLEAPRTKKKQTEKDLEENDRGES